LPAVSVASPTQPRSAALRWRSFEAWVGTRRSALALFGLALVVFAVESAVLPAFPGRDMVRYVQTYVQLPYHDIVLPSVMNTRGPFAALGVGVPLEIGGVAAEVWLALLYAGSIVAWGAVALTFGKRAAILTSALLLVYPGYGILFHGLASDALFAAGFAGWSLLLVRAMLRPSVLSFFLAGLGMGGLVLVRPSNQVLVVMALAPFFLGAAWRDRLRWFAAFFVGSALLTQGWKAIAEARYGDGTTLRPSSAALAVAVLLLAILVVPPRRWAWLGGAAALLAAAFLVVERPAPKSPTSYVRTVAQLPGGNPFAFRVFEIDPIAAPTNGPASRHLAELVRRDLLTTEPYRSYGVTVDTVFTSRSDRVFSDVQSLPGSDIGAVANEAIRRRPWHFGFGVVKTFLDMLWIKRVYGPEPVPEEAPTAMNGSGHGGATIVVNGKTLPAPSEGQPIPSSRGGPVFGPSVGGVRQVWRSGTEYSLVFDDPVGERRVAAFDRDTNRLTARLPARDSDLTLVHRFNQVSHVFPPSLFWLVLGIAALAIRRPRRSLVALAPSVAGLVVAITTALIAFPVAEYVMPVTPAFVLLAAVGLVGADPRGGLRLGRSRASESERAADAE
jgi:hypothetical protein